MTTTATYAVAELSSLSLSQLVALYNANAEKTVKAFKTKPIALERCEKLADGAALTRTDVGTGYVYAFETAEQRETRLAGLSHNEAIDRDERSDEFDADDSGAQEHVVQPEADDAKHPVPEVRMIAEMAKTDTSTPKRRGPAPAFADDDVITVLRPIEAARRSPKAANWARYELYKDGMTVREYLEAAVKLQGATVTRWRGDLIWDHARGNVGFYTARQWANSQAGRDIEDDGEAQS